MSVFSLVSRSFGALSLPAASSGLLTKRQKSNLRKPTSAIGALPLPADASESMAFRHIPAKNLHVSRPTRWLESRFHFNFAEYFNASNADFGNLRVLNDDIVQPHSGFGTHPHRDMEIVTYVIDGQLTHKDSMGTAESLGRGSVQYMSAGTGVTHSEMNNGDDLLRFLQIWIKPNARSLKPNYGSRVYRKKERHNKVQHVLTSFDQMGDKDSGEGVIPIHQDANIYVTEMDAGFSLPFRVEKNRQLYMVCIEGKVEVNDTMAMNARDAMEVVPPKGTVLPLTFKADEKEGAHLLLIELSQKY